jgi:glucose-6-phosphate-specific signal transduction histidine kinase
MTYSMVMAQEESVPLHRKRLWTRRVLSVLAGVVAIFVLSSATDLVLETTGVLPSAPLFDTGLLLLATAYRIIFSVLASYIVARLAPDHQMRHALAFGAVGVVVSTVGVIVNTQMQLGAAWYPLLLVAVALPCAWCGGKLFQLTAR